jgi:hypothetical protein
VRLGEKGKGIVRDFCRRSVALVRHHLERALYQIRLARVREKRAQAYNGKIPMDDYVMEYLDFWHRYEERGE